MESWLLMAKYCTRSSFLKIKSVTTSSFIWKSILWGSDLMEKGLRWRIVSSAQVSIYGNRWISIKTPYKVTTTRCLHPTTIVQELTLNTCQWNENMIHEAFLPHEDEAIFQIPFPIHSPTDTIKHPQQVCTSDDSLLKW